MGNKQRAPRPVCGNPVEPAIAVESNISPAALVLVVLVPVVLVPVVLVPVVLVPVVLVTVLLVLVVVPPGRHPN